MIKIEYILSFWFQIDMNISSREEPDIKLFLLFYSDMYNDSFII